MNQNQALICSRKDYSYFQTISTRWNDNDIYGHVNNVVYYSYFDTVINTWLIRVGGLNIHNGEAIGVCAESHCAFLNALSFPEDVEAGLRIAKLGNSSVRYDIGLFRVGCEVPAATGWFVDVFVDRITRRPRPIDSTLRAALNTLLIKAADV